MFVGIGPLGRITRAKIFFKVQNISQTKDFLLAHNNMEGNASHWFKFWSQTTKNPSWEELSMVLSRRFVGKRQFEHFKAKKLRS